VPASVASPGSVILVSPVSEDSDTSAVDSSSATFGFEATADFIWISLLIASSVSGLERLESSSSTSALEMSSNGESSITTSTSYVTSPDASSMSVTVTVLS